MTKDDKAQIARAFYAYSQASTLCSNVLYNLSQTELPDLRAGYGQLVRNHDAARRDMLETLKQFGLIKG